MGTAKLNIWVSAIDNPCAIDSRTWFVNIYDCDGNILEWCGRHYVVVPARCGHLEVEVPPGCYRINAVWGFWLDPGGSHYHVNHFTDSAIVQVSCEQVVCVKLFNPSIHRCGIIFLQALKSLVYQKAIPRNLAQPVELALKKLLETLPRPVKGFELDHLDEIEGLLKEQEKMAKEEKAK